MSRQQKPYPKELCKSPTYRSWESMKSRCNGTGGKKNIKWYSGRGIQYCFRWEYFADFLEDMGIRPEGKTLDRINNDLGYSKDNCRWASLSEQAIKRSHRLGQTRACRIVKVVGSSVTDLIYKTLAAKTKVIEKVMA